ncbi:MAG: target of Sbf [Trizodia sp. TS-e1964]|nr:MAG: target of Sbf [Trizodia sp. TS-e1964]
MRFSPTAGAVVAACLSGAAVADLCGSDKVVVNQYTYCSAVQAITYTGLGGSGSFNALTNMDSLTGKCQTTPQSYSGGMAPLNGEVAMVFRGPINLKQFGWYTGPTAPKAKRSEFHGNHRRHAHQRFHEHRNEARDVHERALGDTVTATIDGKVQTWANDYGAGGATAAAPAPASSAASSIPAAQNSPAPKVDTSSTTPSGDWVRKGYYDSKAGTAEGLTFLNHFGGKGSGVWDMSFGNSLSFMSADAKDGSATSQILKDVLVESGHEFVVFTDKKYDGTSYVRPGTTAYHGFDGAKKAFVFEFSMPDDGKCTNLNDNMPAVWMLNADIPRTLQYGTTDCQSCWKSGCGELDLFECLSCGNPRLVSCLHGGAHEGCSVDWFKRPSAATMKAIAIFTGDLQKAHIQVLDDSFVFGTTLTDAVIMDLVNNPKGVASTHALV